jgi:hypothetical protein
MAHSKPAAVCCFGKPYSLTVGPPSWRQRCRGNASMKVPRLTPHSYMRQYPVDWAEGLTAHYKRKASCLQFMQHVQRLSAAFCVKLQLVWDRTSPRVPSACMGTFTKPWSIQLQW